jgi:hypothetical protein
MLTFKAGKLAAVERLWAYQNDDSSVAITKSLVGVLNSLIKDGNSTCVVQSVVSDARRGGRNHLPELRQTKPEDLSRQNRRL